MKKFLSLLLASCLVFTPLAFSVSTDTIFDTDTKLMLHMDGTDASTTFTDSSSGGKTVTANGDAQIDTAQKVFGTGSGLFDGTGDYLSSTDSADFDLGSGDFTIDYRVRPGAGWSDNHTQVSNFDANNNRGWTCGYNQSVLGGLLFIYTTDGTSSTQTIYNPGYDFPATETQYHVAWVRSGANLYLFVDGTQQGSTHNIGTTTIFNSSADLTVGCVFSSGAAANLFNGHIDELRVVKGTAVWTSNFTPPTAAYTPPTSRRIFIS